jgi:hypothetical protein
MGSFWPTLLLFLKNAEEKRLYLLNYRNIMELVVFLKFNFDRTDVKLVIIFPIRIWNLYFSNLIWFVLNYRCLKRFLCCLNRSCFHKFLWIDLFFFILEEVVNSTMCTKSSKISLHCISGMRYLLMFLR